MEFLPSLYVSFWTWGYTENDIHPEELNSQKDFPQITDLNYAFIHILSTCLCVCSDAYTKDVMAMENGCPKAKKNNSFYWLIKHRIFKFQCVGGTCNAE